MFWLNRMGYTAQVKIDGLVVFSKIKTKRFPRPQDMDEICLKIEFVAH
jgi:hypothetical protein